MVIHSIKIISIVKFVVFFFTLPRTKIAIWIVCTKHQFVKCKLNEDSLQMVNDDEPKQFL